MHMSVTEGINYAMIPISSSITRAVLAQVQGKKFAIKQQTTMNILISARVEYLDVLNQLYTALLLNYCLHIELVNIN